MLFRKLQHRVHRVNENLQIILIKSCGYCLKLFFASSLAEKELHEFSSVVGHDFNLLKIYSLECCGYSKFAKKSPCFSARGLVIFSITIYLMTDILPSPCSYFSGILSNVRIYAAKTSLDVA